MSSGEQRLQPRKKPRQVRSELMRQRILDAAARVFAEHGYAAGTTNRIAELARISVGSLYQYYPNKDAILLELVTRHMDAGVAATERLEREELSGPLAEVIRVFVRATIDNHLDDPQLLQVMLEQAPRSPALRERVARHQKSRVAYAKDLLDRHPEVRVADTETAARLIVSTVELVVHQLIAAPDPVPIPRFETELTAMLTTYLTTPPPESRTPKATTPGQDQPSKVGMPKATKLVRE
ncbi:TetR/AcrR family transcriptional regulator [Amycolatopsis samaneae]|uniref:TetR/AcrR family transcriptional regulator n=1 Tax=Amycolatopsis samaneae TaxID=664691 RepID=A0ABW5GDA4_9PSEU